MHKSFAKIGFFLTCLIMAGAVSNVAAQFTMGADVSWLARSEALGVRFYDSNGKSGDCLAIMKAKGINAIRLRTWVNPSMTDDFSGHCSQKETIDMAVRCKNLGLKVMVDFHYSDSWASLGLQPTPAAWVAMTYSQMKTELSNYVGGFCTAMKAAGVSPAWFQNGNDINMGIVNPTGNVTSHPDQMTGLLNAGYDAIKKVFPNAKVIIATAQPQRTTGDTMITRYKRYGGKFDALGFSSYANTNTIDPVLSSVKALHDKYKCEVFMVEIGSNETPSLQKTLIEKWDAGIKSMNSSNAGGTFWWEPEAYSVPGKWADALFDASGKATLAWDAYATVLKKSIPITTEANQPALVGKPFGKAANLVNTAADKISIHGDGRFTYSIYDINGREMESGAALNAVDAGTKLNAGTYLVKIRDQQRNITVKVTKY